MKPIDTHRIRFERQIVGATVTAVLLEPDTDGGWQPVIFLQRGKGPEIALAARRDPEGNGPGTFVLYGPLPALASGQNPTPRLTEIAQIGGQ